MKVGNAIIVVVILVVAMGFYFQATEPKKVSRLQKDFFALFSTPTAPPESESTTSSEDAPPPSGPSPLIKRLAAPALKGAAKEEAAISNVESMSPALAPATAAPLPTWKAPANLPAKPNWTLTTTEGHTYTNVKIVKVDPANVSILDDSGGATIAIATLPADLQKQLNYNPQLAANWAIGKLVTGNLIRLENGVGQRVPDSAIDGVKYFAIYYSAQWCPPCHKFTPDLVKFYNDFKPTHPNFEIIFVSEDHNVDEMIGYMKEMSMPWLAMDFGSLGHGGGGSFKAEGIENFAGTGIPDLVLVNATGKVLSDSFRDDKYVGPQAVIDDIKTKVQ